MEGVTVIPKDTLSTTTTEILTGGKTQGIAIEKPNRPNDQCGFQDIYIESESTARTIFYIIFLSKPVGCR